MEKESCGQFHSLSIEPHLVGSMIGQPTLLSESVNFCFLSEKCGKLLIYLFITPKGSVFYDCLPIFKPISSAIFS